MIIGAFNVAARCMIAKFFPANIDLKIKVGSGGLAPSRIEHGQKVIDTLGQETPAAPLLESSMARLESDIFDENTKGIEINAMNIFTIGNMFGEPGIAKIGHTLLDFVSNTPKTLNKDAMGVLGGFYDVLKAVRNNPHESIIGQLSTALEQTCDRYFEKHPPVKQTVQSQKPTPQMVTLQQQLRR